jgi:mannose-1-phosphate guanylyltransferase/mannose-6-phosphate isomerase
MTAIDQQDATARTGRTDRPWGWFELLGQLPGSKVKRIHVFAGQQISLQKHLHRAEHWVVVAGTARVTVGDRVVDLAVGQHADIALGQVHRLANATSLPVEVIEVQWGDYLGEDDIVRLHDDYGRI